MRKPGIALVAVLVAALAAAVAGAEPGEQTGPSSSQSPYVVRSQPGVVTRSILTVGDSVNKKPDGVTPYRMVGIPDGLGAFDNGDGTFTLLMNHELPGNGVVRAHGSVGAFVSKWTIEKGSLRVLRGEDLAQQLMLWNGSRYTADTSALSRLCSADLAAPAAFYNAATGKGFDGRLFLNGEESGTEGRAWAHGMNGTSWQLPYLGRFAWENAVASPHSGDKTAVVGLDDGLDGQVYVYVGTKQTTGNVVEKAGLYGGSLYGIKVQGLAAESDATVLAADTRFELANLGNVSGILGSTLNGNSNSAGVTRFLRPEDGSFDPTNPRYFYFVTTNGFNKPSKLWRLTFDDPTNPAAGGTIETLLSGTEGQQMMDNITVNDRGQVLIQEDPGNQAVIAKLWLYSPTTDTLTEIAHHDPDRFAPGSPGFVTQDEESSGIIPAPFLGNGKYLLDVQAHYRTDDELVEGGQLLQLHIPPGKFK